MGSVSPVLRVGCGTLMLGSAIWLAPSVAPAAEVEVEPQAATTAQPSGMSASTVTTVHELGGEFGQRRSAVLIERDDERVQVHIHRKQAPLPVPEPVDSGDRIIIRGFYGDSFPFGSGCGSVDVEVDLDGFEAEIEGAFGFGFPFSKGCDRRRETRERKRGALNRMRERLERKQEKWEHRHRRHEKQADPREVEAEPGVFDL